MALFVILLFFSIILPGYGDLLLHTLSGQVSGGNYSYYALTYEGPISLSLVTIQGDADLYVSQFLSKPTYDHLAYCLHSATCGVDVVNLPKSFKRPVGIGVYGHSSHEISLYTLDVILRESAEESAGTDEAIIGEEEDLENEEEFEVPFKEPHVSLNAEDRHKFRDTSRRKISFRYPESGENKDRIEDIEEESRQEEEPFFWSVVWSLLELIFELFFL